MHISLNEVEATAANAAMGVGLPPSLGEDAGRMATLMLRSGFGTLSDLVDALDAVDGGASVGLDADRVSAGGLVPVNGAKRLSALQAGPTACDLRLAVAEAAGTPSRRQPWNGPQAVAGVPPCDGGRISSARLSPRTARNP